MEHTLLHFRIWLNAGNRLRETGEAVNTSNQNIFNTSIMEIGQYRPPVNNSLTFRQTQQLFPTNNYDEIFHPERAKLEQPRHPVLASIFLDSSKITSKKTMVFTVDLAVRSTDFWVDGILSTSRRIPDENLYRDKIVLNVALNNKGWTVRFVESDDNWDENQDTELSRDDDGHYIQLHNTKGFRAKLYFDLTPWS